MTVQLEMEMAARVGRMQLPVEYQICEHLSFPGCNIHDIHSVQVSVYPVRPVAVVAVVAVALLE